MNNSTSHQSSQYCALQTDAFHFTIIVLYALIFLISLVGNILVIVVVYRNKSLRNTTNYFIVNMAVSDLVVPALTIPRMMKELITRSPVWIVSGAAGEGLCKSIYFLIDVSPLVSILSLILISWDRFCAVMFPMRNQTNRFPPRWLAITLTWVISCAVFAPYFYVFRLKTFQGQVYCTFSWEPALHHVNTQRVYSTIIVVTFICVPCFMLTFFYLSICAVIIKQKTVGVKSQSGSATRDRKTRKVVKLVFTIVFVTAICWGPYGVLLLLLSFEYDWARPSGCQWSLYFLVAQFLATSNAAINPMIYFIYIQSYKKELKRILTYVSRLVPTFSNAGPLLGAPQNIEMNELQH